MSTYCTGKSNTVNQWETRIANCDSLKQILTGERVFESSKWKLEYGYC
jgi:hypothetical protein